MSDIYVCDCCGFIQTEDGYTGVCPACGSSAFVKESNPPNRRIARMFEELNMLRALSDRVRVYMATFTGEDKPAILQGIETLLEQHSEKF